LERNEQAYVQFLRRHAEGDWGDIDSEDARANRAAVLTGGRILSVYTLQDGTRVWCITETADDDGHREATTFLLPEEY
jgi:hypothetical protein